MCAHQKTLLLPMLPTHSRLDKYFHSNNRWVCFESILPECLLSSVAIRPPTIDDECHMRVRVQTLRFGWWRRRHRSKLAAHRYRLQTKNFMWPTDRFNCPIVSMAGGVCFNNCTFDDRWPLLITRFDGFSAVFQFRNANYRVAKFFLFFAKTITPTKD